MTRLDAIKAMELEKKAKTERILKRAVLTLAIAGTVVLANLTISCAARSNIAVKARDSVAIYDNGFLYDADGNIYQKYFNVKDRTVVNVTYDTKNTDIVDDDEPMVAIPVR